MSNKKYILNKTIAENIASSYQHLIGRSFNLKHHNNCTIDRIDLMDSGNESWEVVLVHDIFKPPSIGIFPIFKAFGDNTLKNKKFKYLKKLIKLKNFIF